MIGTHSIELKSLQESKIFQLLWWTRSNGIQGSRVSLLDLITWISILDTQNWTFITELSVHGELCQRDEMSKLRKWSQRWETRKVARRCIKVEEAKVRGWEQRRESGMSQVYWGKQKHWAGSENFERVLGNVSLASEWGPLGVIGVMERKWSSFFFPDKQILLDSLVVIKDFHGWDAGSFNEKDIPWWLRVATWILVQRLPRGPGTLLQSTADVGRAETKGPSVGSTALCN